MQPSHAANAGGIVEIELKMGSKRHVDERAMLVDQIQVAEAGGVRKFPKGESRSCLQRPTHHAIQSAMPTSLGAEEWLGCGSRAWLRAP